MRFRRISVLASALSMMVVSLSLQSCSPDHSKTVVAEYGNEKITLGEFESVYAKNTGGIETAKKDSLSKLKNFLDLYVNFRMKLRDAHLRGFETNPSLMSELKDYKEKIGVSYMLEKDIVEPGIKDLYDKRKYELRVSHIMVGIDSTGEESARQKAASIIDRINKGEKFEDLAKEFSIDQFSKNNGGDVYYITAGLIFPNFENAAYATEVGKVYQEPVKTRYGFHVIKVTDKRERMPEINAAHILIDFKDSVKTDTAAAYAKIQDIRKQIIEGADFAAMAAKYSEDPGTSKKGGDLGFFERRMMVKEFDEAAFNLKPGQVSDIVRSPYGYHIIKMLAAKPYDSYESEKEKLKKLFRKTRYDEAYSNYVGSLKKKYNVKVNDQVKEFIEGRKDSARVGAAYWESPWRAQVKDNALFFVDNQPVAVDSFFNTIQDQQEFAGQLIDKSLLERAIDRVGTDKVLLKEALQLDKRDPQFAELMDDYKNGIFIFKLQDEEVWGKIKPDSTKLYEYYLKTKDNYMWPERVSFSEIYSKSDSLINLYYDRLTKGESFDSLAKKYTERPGYKEKTGMYPLMDVKTSLLSTKANELSRAGDYTKPFRNASAYSIVRLNAKDVKRVKTFEEAKAEVSGAFQESESKRLEEEYLSTLKNKYKPVTYYEKLEEAFKTKN